MTPREDLAIGSFLQLIDAVQYIHIYIPMYTYIQIKPHGEGGEGASPAPAAAMSRDYNMSIYQSIGQSEAPMTGPTTTAMTTTMTAAWARNGSRSVHSTGAESTLSPPPGTLDLLSDDSQVKSRAVGTS